MTNTPDKSEMEALERVERRLNNAWAKHGFMTLTVSDLREVVSLARASSRPADQVPDMVEAANAVGSALDDWIRIVVVRNELNPDLRHYVWKRSPTYEEVQEAMRANNELAETLAALQAVPASGEVGWQPIESAPKDGQFFAAYFYEERGEWVYDVATWYNGHACGINDGSGPWTHWRLLPAPPALKASGEE